MRLVKIVFTVLAVTNYFYVSADDEILEPHEEKTTPSPLDHHSFLALLNIVFVDGSKHSCTGTIIHDFVVITAAHCFLAQDSPKDVELSDSFVVMGSKQHFDTGTENYLPIERVVIHPKYRGWTADIALVYTFTEMTSDKSGKIITMGGEGTTMNSNVTMLSWRLCTDKEGRSIKCPRFKGTTISDCNNSSDNDDNEEYNKRTGTKEPLRIGPPLVEEYGSKHASSQYQLVERHKSASTPMLDFASVTTPPYKYYKSDAPNKFHESDAPNKTHEANAPNKSHETDAPTESHETGAPNESHDTGAPIESHETGAPKESQETDIPDEFHNTNIDTLKRTREPDAPNGFFEPKTRTESRKPKARNKFPELEPRNESHETDAPNESNERETIMIEENGMPRRRHLFDRNIVNMRDAKLREGNLTIESFKFVNVENCKKLVEEALPAIYGISTKENLCYSNEHYFISNVDSGAPVIHNGRLVAVTVGGVKVDSDHMGIGIKIDCYCPWIEQNLPPENNLLECCSSCCTREQPVLRKSKHDMEHTDRSWSPTFF